MLNIIRKIKKLFFLLPVNIYRRALFHGVAAAIEHEKLLKNKSYKTIVDIGANKGQFSLVARNIFNKAKIFSFDPLESSERIFNKVFSNDKNTNFFNVAIGPSQERRTIHISKKEDSSSILSIRKLQSDLFPGTEESHEATISVDRLDSFINGSQIESPALLKLDVQGFEFEALIGCKKLLNFFDEIYCECSFYELYKDQKLVSNIIELLSENDFILTGFYNTSYDENGFAIQSDFLFKKRKG
jgi:FkbM family methyltransferase